ncbi:MAG TPA: hypothetical protein VHR66_27560 [Gemmataceae bacterium]|jgi:hydroxymethylpyrimidine pyrophosphatase-like HAD family hydrolase|nr:hypothetical protein [Gemmataceae bacterium]
MVRTTPITELDILDSIVSSNGASLFTTAAESLLEFKLPTRDVNHVRKLLQKNNAGTIDADERISLEKYLRVGQFLDLLHAKARLSLAKRPRTK